MGAVLKPAIRLFVVDDHPVVRDGVELLTHMSTRKIQIVGYAANGQHAREAVADAKPDVVLVDLRLPDTLAPELIRELHALAPNAKLLVFTAYPEHPAVEAALLAGAHGVLPKDAARMDLVAAILSCVDQESVDGARSDGTNRSERSPIARREYDVLRRVARGETNQEIAEAMTLSSNTVKTYIHSLMQKLGARNRVEAITRAREIGLL